MSLSHRVLFCSWATLSILGGAILMSFHQSFLAPGPAILELALPASNNHLRALHLLSSGCGCSQRVMQHLVKRRPRASMTEQVIVFEAGGPALAGTTELVSALASEGFKVQRLPISAIPTKAELRGVPLLIVVSPDGSILYMGGYGAAYDQDQTILARVQNHQQALPFETVGCAIGRRVQHAADPFHLKY